MTSRKVTIKDVAREAGVSISTVSNALNGVNVLHPLTKQHILEVAERLHYVPNLNGRNLKSQATKVIGLFIPCLTGSYHGMLADSIYKISLHIERRLKPHKYGIVEVVKSGKKQRNVGNSYFIPAPLLHHYSYT